MFALSLFLLVIAVLGYLSIKEMLVLKVASPEILMITVGALAFFFVIANWNSLKVKPATS